MKYVSLDPPGTYCNYAALRDALKDHRGETFLDAGCGGGAISKELLRFGMTGWGVDFSDRALAVARARLAQELAEGRYELHQADLEALPKDFPKADVAVSYMVMEHIEDDAGFLKKMARQVKPGGRIVVAAPGRKDCWNIEDETVGHLRRYDRADMQAVLERAGLQDIEVRSVAVPTANVLLKIGAWVIARSNESEKRNLSQREQTETSGIREIPWRTVFPVWVKLFVNRVTMWPLTALQRLFYRTELGTTMMGIARTPD